MSAVVIVHPACEWRVCEFILAGFWIRCRRGRHRSYLVLSRAKGAM